MNDLRQVYDRLPDEAKDAVMARLYDTMKWRGWARTKDSPNPPGTENIIEAVCEIAETFAAHGTEIAEYT